MELELELELPEPSAAQADYARAAPWPHLVLRDALDRDLVARAAQELVDVQVQQLSAVTTRRQLKTESPHEQVLGPGTRALLALFEGSRWRAFAEQVTGVAPLENDAERYGAGLHLTPPGGMTMVHTDFERHPDGRYHRVNTMVYLNQGWQPHWGGALELWPADMAACGVRVLPEAGTVVLWETHSGTPHGLPDPVRAPDGRGRGALAVYHYTQAPPQARPGPRLATYRRRPQDPWWTGLPTQGDLRLALRRRRGL